jgi:hypothetical protein
MPEIRRFKSEDIGGELLQIITSGLYRDPLDTLREYVQNGIDANARHIEINISSDVVTVRDDGDGMTRPVAEAAIRLGISDKNPIANVGFRGIGIYSAFNTCKKLEVYTRPESGEPSLLRFDFDKMRNRLEAEEKRKLAKKLPELYLEELLSEGVSVEDCPDCPFTPAGTMVMMIGVKGSQYKRFTDRTQVKRYLESVVPLPFRKDFRHKKAIEASFQRLGFKIIDLSLVFDGRKEQLYRPYTNAMFTLEQGLGPNFYKLPSLMPGESLGFAWVILNDDRKYLPAFDLRGLLIRKHDFAVGDRQTFARHFSRSVFNNRITGEIIITSDTLIPNAARTDFEPGQPSDALQIALANLARDISSWAEDVQNNLKADEELQTIAPDVFAIAKQIPAVERDVQELLLLNTRLVGYAGRLDLHRRLLEKSNNDLLQKTDRAIQQSQSAIEQVLASPRDRAKTRPRRIKAAQKLQDQAPEVALLALAKDRPRTIAQVAASFGIEVSPEMRKLIEYIDQEVVKPKHSTEDYTEMLNSLRSYLDEVL